jgi:hypothetical protein
MTKYHIFLSKFEESPFRCTASKPSAKAAAKKAKANKPT